MTARAFIAGCAGTSLSDDEKRFFADACPWALILFKRNIENPAQVRELTRSFRAVVSRPGAPVLVDQEGGRVQRLGPPHWPKFPAAEAMVMAGGTDGAADTVRLGARLIASDLVPLGINIDCLPLADLRHPGAHDIIGDRAYGSDPAQVAVLARAAAEGLLAGGVLPVVKHIPGHGRAVSDSHLELPRVAASQAELERTDFLPFRLLADLPIAMTAHVVYEAIDAERPATVSRTVIDRVVRGFIRFDGLLMSDDLSMKALTGSFAERTRGALEAGCDLALHCNGNLAEMREIAAASPVLAGKSLDRAEKALDRLNSAPESFDRAEAWSRFSAMIRTA
jgi:beta-N-acetylhexosaminidase